MLSLTQSIENCQPFNLTTSEIQEWQTEAVYMVDALKMSDRQILTVMGILNAYTWRALVDYQVYNIDNDGEYHWENLHRLVKNPSIMYAHTSLSEYMAKFWDGAFKNRKTLYKWRLVLLDYELFNYDHANRPKGARWGHEHGVPDQGVATPPELESLNVIKMVIWYQTLYSVLESRMGKEKLFSFMPKHGGMLMIQVYNAVFNDLADFRGNVIVDNPSIYIPVVDDGFKRQTIVWTWKKLNGVTKNIWRSLVKRVGAIAENVRWRRTPWVQLAELPY